MTNRILRRSSDHLPLLLLLSRRVSLSIIRSAHTPRSRHPNLLQRIPPCNSIGGRALVGGRGRGRVR